MLPPTHYLQLPALASTSSCSQQFRLCDQGVCKSDTAVKEVKLLADVCPWLKESTCTTVSPSEQVRAAKHCTNMHVHTLNPALHVHISAPICTLQFPTNCPHDGQVSLNDNVTAVLLPTHQLFTMPPAKNAEGNRRCAPAPILTLPTSVKLYTPSTYEAMLLRRTPSP